MPVANLFCKDSEVVSGRAQRRFADDQEIVAALRSEAELLFAKPIPIAISGPSNIGNYLATLNIPAISGFGVTYRNLHAADECIEINSIEPVYQVYIRTLKRLLQAD